MGTFNDSRKHQFGRVSSQQTEQMHLLFECIRDTQTGKFEKIAKRNVVITYPHDGGISAYFNKQMCDVCGVEIIPLIILKLATKPTTKDIVCR